MKTTSIILSGLSVLTVLFFNVSCQELVIDTQPDGVPHMETDVLSEYVRTAVSPQKITFNVSSTTPWKIERSSDAEWCDVTPVSSALGALSSEVSIVLQENTGYEDRETMLTLSAEGIEKKYDIRVLQTRKGKLFVQPIDEAFEPEGGEKKIIITSNNDWELRSDSQWLTFEPSKGVASDEPQEIKVKASVNSGAKRTTTVYLTTSAEEEKTFEVTQKGFYIEIADVEGNSVEFPSEGGTMAFNVKSNVEWSLSCADESVTLAKGENNSFTVKMRGNNLFVTKETKVRLLPSDPELEGLVETELTLTQPLNFWNVGGTSEIDENGYLVLTSTSADPKSRYATRKAYGLGTYIWEFDEINLAPSGIIHVQMYPDEGGNANVYYTIGGTRPAFNTGGTLISDVTHSEVGEWTEATMPGLSNDILNEAKNLKITILPHEDNDQLIDITLYVDDKEYGSIRDYVNLWYHKNSFAFPVYFGLEPDAEATSSMTIKSFDIIPYEE